MAYVTIPFEYRPERDRVVPISVCDTNSAGKPIAQGWIDALVEVADPIRWLARTILEDVWRSSELADETLDELSVLHGNDLGASPESQVYAHARWKARDKRAGGRRERLGFNVEVIEAVVCLIRDPHDLAQEYERKEFLTQLDARLAELGFEDVRKMVNLLIQGYDPKEIYNRFGITRYSYTHRLWRAIRKALNGL
jgi:hypothetical protein